VSWWRAESNTVDSVDSNHGTLTGNAIFGAGRVGQGFVFDGNGDGVRIGNPTNLQLQNFTIEAWIKRSSSSVVSLSLGGLWPSSSAMARAATPSDCWQRTTFPQQSGH
jgi:hypothetical protein